MALIAAKLLTPSDLSFFAPHLRASKQKGLNLNSDIFVRAFYPGLENRFEEFVFPLRIIGPGGAGVHALSRKVTRTPGAKNWRLNGEIVMNPPDSAHRYDRLAEGDVALLAFEGDLKPDSVSLVLVSAQSDSRLHARIRGALPFEGRKSMLPITAELIDEWLDATRAEYGASHPLALIVLPSSTEEALFGSSEVQREVANSNGLGSAISKDCVQRQIRGTEETGNRGEEAFAIWLAAHDQPEGTSVWVSATHARAAYDFKVQRPWWDPGMEVAFVDVKATKGACNSPIHMSMSEIRWAARQPGYRIARVYDLAGGSPGIKILSGVHERCRTLVNGCISSLPRGVAIDSLEMSVDGFQEVLAELLPAPDEEPT